MKKFGSIVVALVLVCVGGVSDVEALGAVEERAEEVIAFYAENPSMFDRTDDPTGYAKSAVYHAMARYAAGDIEGGNELAAYIFDNPGGASMFLVMAGMDLYLRYGEHMPEDVRESARNFITGYSEYPFGSTENHSAMTAAGGYLAAQTWPDWDQAEEVRESTRESIFELVDNLARRGLAEYDSPIYHTFFVNPLLSVYDHAEDEEMRRRAEIGLDIALADMAPEWVDGAWGASTLRTGNFQTDAQDGYIAALTGYVYFGGRAKPAQNDGCGVMSAVSSYRPPEIIQIMGTDRQEPYVHRETHMAWHGARKTSFVNQTYALFSQYDGNGSLFWSDQMLRSGLVWSSVEPGAKFTVKAPTNNLTGESPNNQVLQHKGVLAGVAKEEMTGFVPESGAVVEQREEDGWLFLNGGAVYIAFTCRDGYDWGESIEVQGVHPQYLTWDDSNWTEEYGTFTFGGGATGWVIQTAHPDEFDGFDAFVNAVLEGPGAVFSEHEEGEPSTVYEDLDGNVLEITFDGRGGGDGTDRRLVNGEPLDYAAWPRFDNPWMQGEVEGDELVMEHGGYRRVYDFNSWTIAEEGEL